MGFIVTAAFIGRVALHHRAAHMIYDLFPEVRAEEILVSRFTGMDFDGHIAGELGGNAAVADFLEAQGLEYGYATFWNSQSLTLISNSDVRVRGVNVTSKDGVTPYYYQTNITWYEDQDGVEKYFVALTNYEASVLNYNSKWNFIKETHLLETLDCEGFKIFVFDTNIFTVE